MIARLGLDAALAAGGVPDGLRLWLVLVTYILLMADAAWPTGRLPGMTAAALGTAANGIAIVVNGGWMPVWQPSLAAAGFDPTPSIRTSTRLLAGPVDAYFFAHGGPLVDIIPSRSRCIQSVASIGDLLLGAGLAFFVFASRFDRPRLRRRRSRVSDPGRPASRARPARPAMPAAFGHSYVRLATNGAFSAMWLGQVVSSLGDRVHQVALVFLVARSHRQLARWRWAWSSPR